MERELIMAERKYVERGVGGRKLEEGEVFEGKFIEIQPGPQSDILVFEKDDGSIDRVWASFQLSQNLTEEDCGKFVRIEYKGLKKTAGGREMHDFSVAVCQDVEN